MGCDTNIFLETSEDGKKWELSKEPIYYTYTEFHIKTGKEEKIKENIVTTSGNDYRYGSSEDKEPNDPPRVGELQVGRFYDLWGIMAGVRGYIPPGLKIELNGLERAQYLLSGEEPPVVGVARGLPKDLSPEVDAVAKADLNDKKGAAHSPSWGTLKDLEGWLTLHRTRGGSYGQYKPLRDYMRKLEEKGVRTRIVFWFDS